jgi:hypothetical protein
VSYSSVICPDVRALRTLIQMVWPCDNRLLQKLLRSIPRVGMRPALRGGMTMRMRSSVRTAGRSILMMVALVSFGSIEATAQTRVAVSLDTGPLFTGVAFGGGGSADSAGSAFVGAAFGVSDPGYVPATASLRASRTTVGTTATLAAAVGIRTGIATTTRLVAGTTSVSSPARTAIPTGPRAGGPAGVGTTLPDTLTDTSPIRSAAGGGGTGPITRGVHRTGTDTPTGIPTVGIGATGTHECALSTRRV